MSVHNFLPKKAEVILSTAAKNGSISLDEISDFCKYIGEYYKTANSGRRVISYILWRVFLKYQDKYEADYMTLEDSENLIAKLQPIDRFLKYLQGNIELEPDEIIKICDNITRL